MVMRKHKPVSFGRPYGKRSFKEKDLAPGCIILRHRYVRVGPMDADNPPRRGVVIDTGNYADDIQIGIVISCERDPCTRRHNRSKHFSKINRNLTWLVTVMLPSGKLITEAIGSHDGQMSSCGYYGIAPSISTWNWITPGE